MTRHLCATISSQELGPWKIECTIAPIVLAIVVMLLHAAWKPAHFRRLRNRAMAKGWCAMGCAFVCFALGLDERNDPIRAMHGGWHIFGSVAFFFFFDSVSPPPAALADAANSPASEHAADAPRRKSS